MEFDYIFLLLATLGEHSYKDFGARSKYITHEEVIILRCILWCVTTYPCLWCLFERQGQAITSHNICGMWLLVPALNTCFWHTSLDIWFPAQVSTVSASARIVACVSPSVIVWSHLCFTCENEKRNVVQCGANIANKEDVVNRIANEEAKPTYPHIVGGCNRKMPYFCYCILQY